MKQLDNILLSGGANGADVCWGEFAQTMNHDVIHFSFSGHKTTATNDIVYILSEDELFEANEKLVLANKTLGRRLPVTKPWMYNLLRRNWYQVKDSESIYAVGNTTQNALIYNPSALLLGDPTLIESEGDTLCVNGGTSWAIQMFYDRNIDGNIYFYDQLKNKILMTNPTKYGFWIDIGYVSDDQIHTYSEDYQIPSPTGIYAGVGSRDLKENGRKFIEFVYNQ